MSVRESALLEFNNMNNICNIGKIEFDKANHVPQTSLEHSRKHVRYIERILSRSQSLLNFWLSWIDNNGDEQRGLLIDSGEGQTISNLPESSLSRPKKRGWNRRFHSELVFLSIRFESRVITIASISVSCSKRWSILIRKDPLITCLFLAFTF